MDPREQVIEDVISRILDEHGPEAGVLDWDILEGVLKEDYDEKIKKAQERKAKLKELADGKVPLDAPTHRAMTISSVKKAHRAHERLIKRHRRARARDKERGFTNVTPGPELRSRFDGVSVGQDKNGFFVRTHRARCKSYPSMEQIPKSKIAFIKSTG